MGIYTRFVVTKVTYKLARINVAVAVIKTKRCYVSEAESPLFLAENPISSEVLITAPYLAVDSITICSAKKLFHKFNTIQALKEPYFFIKLRDFLFVMAVHVYLVCLGRVAPCMPQPHSVIAMEWGLGCQGYSTLNLGG
jgi:hypothetical protein